MLDFLKKLLWGRSITKRSCKKFMGYLEKIATKPPRTQVVDYDKLYHAILKELGYSGSFGEILKREPREIRNLQEIWELHKLRNTLVHDLEEPKVDLQKQSHRYKKVILGFLKSVSK